MYIHINNCCADVGAPKGTCSSGACAILFDVYFTLLPRLNFDPAQGVVEPEENPEVSVAQKIGSALSQSTRALQRFSSSFSSRSTRVSRVAVVPPPLAPPGDTDVEMDGYPYRIRG